MTAALALSPWPDAGDAATAGRCARAIDELLQMEIGFGRRRDVAYDLLRCVARQNGRVAATWCEPAAAIAALRELMDALALIPGRALKRSGAGAKPFALERATTLLEREAEAWPPGPRALGALSLGLIRAACVRAAADLGGPAGVELACEALDVFDRTRAELAALDALMARRAP